MTQFNPATQSMRIGMMIETDGPGGAEVVLIQLSEELRRRGHTVIEVGPKEGRGWLSGRLSESGFERHTFDLRRAIDPGCLWRMRNMLQKLSLDVVHSHEFTMAVYGAAASRLVGVPHIVTLHGGDEAFEARRRRVALRWANRNSRAFVGVSHHTTEFMVDKLGLRETDVQTVHNGIPANHGDRAGCRGALGLADHDILVLAVGNARPRKGHMLLLEALAHLKSRGLADHLHVAIAGDGPERPRMAQYAEEKGLSDRVHLLGLRRDIGDLQAAADISAMPSFWEGLPLAVLEGMFAGNPVIASDVGGIAEAIRSGSEGILVQPGQAIPIADALALLLDDPEKRNQMGQDALNRAEKLFSVQVMADRYERLYRGQACLKAPPR
ncbi:glycosyltransferase family 4 protein [Myxococcota bacterium]|nr:glycosyltransferase family 4 protein [Myxococcota bacterium]